MKLEALLALLLAAVPAAAQTEPQQQALAQLKRVQGTVDGEIAALDGTVVKDIVYAGDGRLTLVLKQGDALIKSLGAMLKNAKGLAGKAPNPAPFNQICQSLVGAVCAAEPAAGAEGLLTSLKTEDARLRDALKRLKAERKGKSRSASDACDASQQADSATRLAARASTRLAMTAFALNQELAEGELDKALDQAAAQNVGKGKEAAKVKALVRKSQSGAKTRHKAFLKALTGKEKANKDDMARLTEARDRASQSVSVFSGVAQGMKQFTAAGGENADGAGAAGLSLQVSLETEDVRRLVDDIDAMAKAKKTFLISGSSDPKAPDSRGVFPALRSAEGAIERACGIRKGVAEAIKSLSPQP
ncbi:hypothetical protein EPO15_16560 [bacterium]|nr:MAG: hypothetical protein EPO15_16560 [bacterium]